MKFKLGWKRQVIKVLQLIGVYYAGMIAWGFLSAVFSTEPQNIVIIPILMIGSGWVFLAFHHKKTDFNILADKVLSETGLDPRTFMSDDKIIIDSKNKTEHK